MIFKSLMVAGCLAALQSDFAALSPTMPLLPTATAAMSVVHLLRKLVLAFAIGFCFSPAAGRDHSVGEMRKQFHTAAAKPGGTEEGSARLRTVPWLRDAKVKELPAEQRAEIARTTIVGTVHCLLASGMLSGLPFLELIALAWDAWASAALPAPHFVAALRGDPCGITWCVVWLLRLLHVGAINLCMSVFGYHFMIGFFSSSRHHSFKGFWAEYAACRMFAQLMLLAALQSWFAWPDAFNALPPALRAAALAIAAMHSVSCLRFALRNGLLCLRNVEYSEPELAAIFEVWRRREAAVQTLLDAQLAFVARVQDLVERRLEAAPATTMPLLPARGRSATAPSGPSGRWLLLRQVLILARFPSDNLPVPTRRSSRDNVSMPLSPSARSRPRAE